MAIGDLLLEGGDATEVDSIANGVSPFLFTADGDQTRTETRDGRTVTLLVDDADVAVNVARHWANALLGAERARRGLVEAHATLGARAFDLDVVTTAATEMVAALDASAHFVHVRHDSPWHLRWKMLGAAALAGCEESLLRRLLALLAPGLLEAVWKMAGSAGERLLGLERRGFRDVCSGHVCGWTATAVADRCSLAFDSAVLGEVSEKDSHVDDHPRLLALAAASLASAVSSEVARDLLRDVDVDKLMDLATMAPDDRRRRVPCVHLVTSALDAWVEARGAVATGEELALMRRGALLLIAVAPPFNDGLRQVRSFVLGLR